MNYKNFTEQGQVVLVLLLTMLVGLGIGLAVTQKSITDVTTSTQTEQASRAFSAAQAGLERALLNPAPSVVINKTELDNKSSASVTVNANQPVVGAGTPLEFPGVISDTIGQVWLANPATIAAYYTQNNVNLYFGDESAAELPAAEIVAIVKNGSNYVATRTYIDTNNSRTAQNGFTNCPGNPAAITTTSGTGRDFKCLVNIPLSTGTPIMIRVKLLYTTTGQNVAVAPVNFPCGGSLSCELPPQASIFTSTGLSGQSQKTLQVFKTTEVPYLFDYAIFSAADLAK